MSTERAPRYYSTGKSAATFVDEVQTLLADFGAASFHVNFEGWATGINRVRADNTGRRTCSLPDDPRSR